VFEKEGFVFKRARRTPAKPKPAPAAPEATDDPTADQGAAAQRQLAPECGAQPATADPQQQAQALEQQQQQQQQQRQQPEQVPPPQPAQPLLAAAAALPAPAALLGPLRFTMAASELAYLVQWVLATELRLGGSTAGEAAAARAEAAAQAAGNRVSAALMARSAGRAGEEGCGLPAEGAAGEPATVELAPAVVLPFQVARLKAKLAAKRDWWGTGGA
jgi:hypothetical protein